MGVSGHCYIAAESAFHLLGGKARGWKSYVISSKWWKDGLDEGETHWFIGNGKTIVDPTAEQFDQAVRYDLGRPCGFLTLEPSRRAKIVIDRVNMLL